MTVAGGAVEEVRHLCPNELVAVDVDQDHLFVCVAFDHGHLLDAEHLGWSSGADPEEVPTHLQAVLGRNGAADAGDIERPDLW